MSEPQKIIDWYEPQMDAGVRPTQRDMKRLLEEATTAVNTPESDRFKGRFMALRARMDAGEDVTGEIFATLHDAVEWMRFFEKHGNRAEAKLDLRRMQDAQDRKERA